VFLRANYSHGLTNFEHVKCDFVILSLQLLQNCDSEAYEREDVNFNALLTAEGVIG
jgi:hypothetical protein